MEDSNLESIKNMLTEVKNTQSDMDYMLREMEKTLSQLNNVVVGNPTYGQKGLIAELNEIKEYVEKDKMVKNKILGGLTLIGIGWSTFLAYIMYVFKK